MEVFAYKLRSWALLDVLQRLGNLSILIAVLTWLVTWPDRAHHARQTAEAQRRTRILEAWQLFVATESKPSGPGYTLAINELAAEGEVLAGLNVSGGVLRNIRLADGHLDGSKFVKARLLQPDFRRAQLNGSDFSGSIIFGSRKIGESGASLAEAWLTQSVLNDANFTGVDMRNVEIRMSKAVRATFATADARGTHFDLTDLTKAQFNHVWLDDVSFLAATLHGVKFELCCLHGTDFRLADMKDVQIDDATSPKLANIAGAKNLSPQLRARLLARGAVEIEDTNEWERKKRLDRPPDRCLR